MKKAFFPALPALTLLLSPVSCPPSLAAQDLPSFFQASDGAASEEEAPIDRGGFSFPDPADGSGLVWGGSVRAAARAYLDRTDPLESQTRTWPRTRLELRKAAAGADLLVRLNHDGGPGGAGLPGENGAEALRDLVDEAYLRAYLGRFDLEAGLMKVVWGVGDDMHVVDVLNPTDYGDFVNNDYLDRRRGELMFRLVGRVGASSRLELVWEPRTSPDLIPREGPWVPGAARELAATITGKYPSLVANLTAQYVADGVDPAAATALAKITAAGILADPIADEKPSRLRDGTWGLRWSGSAGGQDLGLIYAWTFHRTPSVDMGAFLLDPAQKIRLTYDRFHLVGLEAAAAPGGFNLRAEGAFYLTRDLAGDDPRVRNSRIGGVLGFDRDLLTGKLNLNAQIRSLVTLNPEAIKGNGQGDADYQADGRYTETMAAFRLGGTFLRDRLKPQVSVTTGLERRDLRIEPEILWSPGDDLELGLRYVHYAGDRDGVFGQFRDSGFAEVFAALSF